jgi:hypothetical protein
MTITELSMLADGYTLAVRAEKRARAAYCRTFNAKDGRDVNQAAAKVSHARNSLLNAYSAFKLPSLATHEIEEFKSRITRARQSSVSKVRARLIAEILEEIKRTR